MALPSQRVLAGEAVVHVFVDATQDGLVIAEALSRFAPSEVEPITNDTDRATAIEHLIIGTLLYEPLLATMRRMAHESESARR